MRAVGQTAKEWAVATANGLSHADWLRVEDLLPAALSMPQAQRNDFLRERCGDNPALLAELRSLLQAAEGAGEFLCASVRVITFKRRRPD